MLFTLIIFLLITCTNSCTIMDSAGATALHFENNTLPLGFPTELPPVEGFGYVKIVHLPDPSANPVANGAYHSLASFSIEHESLLLPPMVGHRNCPGCPCTTGDPACYDQTTDLMYVSFNPIDGVLIQRDTGTPYTRCQRAHVLVRHSFHQQTDLLYIGGVQSGQLTLACSFGTLDSTDKWETVQLSAPASEYPATDFRPIVTNTWGTRAASAATVIYEVAATGGGHVFVCGGFTSNAYASADGQCGSIHVDNVFTDASVTVITQTSLAEARFGHEMIWHGDKMYVMGGFGNAGGNGYDAPLASVEVGTLVGWDTSTTGTVTWNTGPALQDGRAYFAAVKWEKTTTQAYILVIGGKTQTEVVGSIEVFDLQQEVWFNFGTNHENGIPRWGLGAGILDNKLYVVGGYTDSSGPPGASRADDTIPPTSAINVINLDGMMNRGTTYGFENAYADYPTGWACYTTSSGGAKPPQDCDDNLGGTTASWTALYNTLTGFTAHSGDFYLGQTITADTENLAMSSPTFTPINDLARVQFWLIGGECQGTSDCSALKTSLVGANLNTYITGAGPSNTGWLGAVITRAAAPWEILGVWSRSHTPSCGYDCWEGFVIDHAFLADYYGVELKFWVFDSYASAADDKIAVDTVTIAEGAKACSMSTGSSTEPAWQGAAVQGDNADGTRSLGYTIGGEYYDTAFSPTTTIRSYDAATNAWNTKTGLQNARCGHAAASKDTTVYVFGGSTDSTGNTNVPGQSLTDNHCLRRVSNDDVVTYNIDTDATTTVASNGNTFRAPMSGMVYYYHASVTGGTALATTDQPRLVTTFQRNEQTNNAQECAEKCRAHPSCNLFWWDDSQTAGNQCTFYSSGTITESGNAADPDVAGRPDTINPTAQFHTIYGKVKTGSPATTTQSSDAACAQICLANPSCQGFGFKTSTGACYTVAVSATVTLTTDTTWNYFEREAPGTRGVSGQVAVNVGGDIYLTGGWEEGCWVNRNAAAQTLTSGTSNTAQQDFTMSVPFDIYHLEHVDAAIAAKSSNLERVTLSIINTQNAAAGGVFTIISSAPAVVGWEDGGNTAEKRFIDQYAATTASYTGTLNTVFDSRPFRTSPAPTNTDFTTYFYPTYPSDYSKENWTFRIFVQSGATYQVFYETFRLNLCYKTFPKSNIFRWGLGTAAPTKVTSMITGRIGHASVAVGTRIYSMGGGIKGGTANLEIIPTNTVEYVDVHPSATSTPVSAASMTTARWWFAAAASGTKIYVLGGISTGAETGIGSATLTPVNTLEWYDTVTNTWASMTTADSGISQERLGAYSFVTNGLWMVTSGYSLLDNPNVYTEIDTADHLLVATSSKLAGSTMYRFSFTAQRVQPAWDEQYFQLSEINLFGTNRSEITDGLTIYCYRCSGTIVSGEPVTNLIDGQSATQFRIHASTGLWPVVIDFVFTSPVVVTGYTFVTASAHEDTSGRDPAAWTALMWNDQRVRWETTDTQSGVVMPWKPREQEFVPGGHIGYCPCNIGPCDDTSSTPYTGDDEWNSGNAGPATGGHVEQPGLPTQSTDDGFTFQAEIEITSVATRQGLISKCRGDGNIAVEGGFIVSLVDSTLKVYSKSETWVNIAGTYTFSEGQIEAVYIEYKGGVWTVLIKDNIWTTTEGIKREMPLHNVAVGGECNTLTGSQVWPWLGKIKQLELQCAEPALMKLIPSGHDDGVDPGQELQLVFSAPMQEGTTPAKFYFRQSIGTPQSQSEVQNTPLTDEYTANNTDYTFLFSEEDTIYGYPQPQNMTEFARYDVKVDPGIVRLKNRRGTFRGITQPGEWYFIVSQIYQKIADCVGQPCGVCRACKSTGEYEYTCTVKPSSTETLKFQIPRISLEPTKQCP